MAKRIAFILSLFVLASPSHAQLDKEFQQQQKKEQQGTNACKDLRKRAEYPIRANHNYMGFIAIINGKRTMIEAYTCKPKYELGKTYPCLRRVYKNEECVMSYNIAPGTSYITSYVKTGPGRAIIAFPDSSKLPKDDPEWVKLLQDKQ